MAEETKSPSDSEGPNPKSTRVEKSTCPLSTSWGTGQYYFCRGSKKETTRAVQDAWNAANLFM